jgi:hypothetical protein
MLVWLPGERPPPLARRFFAGRAELVIGIPIGPCMQSAGMLAMQDCKLMVERNDLELQFRSAAKPTSEP